MRRFLVIPLTAVALAVAGCGGDSSDTASSDPPAAESTPSTDAPAGKENAVEIGMKGLQFAPKDVTVKVGTTVTWKNLEDVPHNVVAEAGADFESDTFGEDGTYEFKAEKPGSVKYVCTIHPGMQGTITVEG
jgi:plastocyanin